MAEQISRREFLRVSASASLALAPLLGIQAREMETRTPLIILFLSGGISAKEFTNPDAPSSPVELRGALGTVATRTPGIHFSEVWPKLAEKQDKIAVLRALDAGGTEHFGGAERMLHRGSVTLSEHVGERSANGGVPYVLLNPDRGFFRTTLRESAAFTPRYKDGVFSAPPMGNAGDLAPRRALLESLDTGHIESPLTKRMDRFRATAFDLLQGGGKFFDALRLPEKDRDRYGRSLAGDQLLLAKRFVEAGAGAVTVYHELPEDWDMHSNLQKRMQSDAPPVDKAVAELIEEIATHRLNATLLMMGEINRTPHVNSGGGRDHWQFGNQAVLAGPKIRGGAVHGRTNNRGQIVDGGAQQGGQLGNTVVVACGEEISPALPRVRDILL